MKVHLTLFFALLLICTGAALAQTPDGTPPSGETVCDAETGAAYGLCTAYCEAMDCDSDEPSPSATACGKVRSKFQNVTGRNVPCEVPVITCPCTSIPKFNADLELLNNCESTPVPGELIFGVGAFDLSFVGVEQPTACGHFHVLNGYTLILPITPEEAAFCRQLVLDATVRNGAPCT